MHSLCFLIIRSNLALVLGGKNVNDTLKLYNIYITVLNLLANEL